MAYVAKTQSSWEVIKRNIKFMFEDRVKAAEDINSYMDVRTFSERVYNTLVPVEVRNQIESFNSLSKLHFPQDESVFFRTVESLPIQFICPIGDDNEVEAMKYTITFHEGRVVPTKWADFYGRDITEARTITADKDAELVEIMTKRAKQIRAVRDAHNEFVAAAASAFNAVKSINQLVKLWEPAWGLLDDDIRSRLKRKAGKTESSTIDEETLRRLNAAYVSAKVAQ